VLEIFEYWIVDPLEGKITTCCVKITVNDDKLEGLKLFTQALPNH